MRRLIGVLRQAGRVLPHAPALPPPSLPWHLRPGAAEHLHRVYAAAHMSD